MNSNPKLQFQDRINKVIHNEAFLAYLKHKNIDLIDFQLDWQKYNSFEALPILYQNAIIVGEIDGK